MTDLYPDPPHLSAFVVSALDSWEALGLAWDVLHGAKCAFTGDVLIARKRGWFRYVSDIKRDVIRPSGGRRDLLARRDTLRIQFRHQRVGTVALGLSPAGEVGEPHPLEVVVYAGPMSFPVETWSTADRRAAQHLMGWMERLLLALVAPTRAQYGAIGIEAAFPTPAVLGSARSSGLWPTTWFWSAQLGSRAAAEEEQLLSGLNPTAVSRSTAGTLFRAWRPWSDPQADEPNLERVISFLRRHVEISS